MTTTASRLAPVPTASPTSLRRVLAALLAAVAVTLAGYVGNVLLLFAANGATAKVLLSLGSYFLLGAVVTAVALFIAGLIGAFSRWYFALIAGLVGAPIGVVVGLAIMLSGTSLTGALWLQVFGTLFSVNLIFWFGIALASTLLGPVVARAVYRARGRELAPVALVRLPASVLVPVAADGAEIADTDADTEKDAGADQLDQQWDAVVTVLTDAGWQAVEVPVADAVPESVFVDDTVVLLGRTAVLASPADGTRRGELDDVELRLREYPLVIERLDEPAGLSGADVLVAGQTVYVAVGERTNADGVRQLRQIAAPLGYAVVALSTASEEPLTAIASVLPDGTVLGDAERLGAASASVVGLRPAPEPEGASVLALDADTLVVSSAAPRTATMLTELGFTVRQVGIGEFERLGGSLGRLVARLG